MKTSGINRQEIPEIVSEKFRANPTKFKISRNWPRYIRKSCRKIQLISPAKSFEKIHDKSPKIYGENSTSEKIWIKFTEVHPIKYRLYSSRQFREKNRENSARFTAEDIKKIQRKTHQNISK
jgi:hypothetical protein